MTQRSLSQNAALHLYCQQVADELNAQGLTVQAVLDKFTMEINWTGDAVKELLWKRAQKGLLKKTSTTELDKLEIEPIFEHVNRFLAQAGVHVPFPSREVDIAELTHKNFPSRTSS